MLSRVVKKECWTTGTEFSYTVINHQTTKGVFMNKLIFGAGISIFCFCSSQAAELLRYGFGTTGSESTVETAPGFAPTFLAPNLTATPVQDTAGTVGIEISSAATTPPGAPFLRVDPQGGSTTPAGAVTANKYFQFTVTPDAGYQFTLDSIAFDVTRGGGSTPRGYLLRSSVDNFSTDLAGGDLLTARPTYTPVSVTLGSPFAELTSPVTFRFYNYAPAAGNSIDYDNFVLNGTVTLVPEPGMLALAGLAGVALLATSRKRRK